MFDPQAAVAHLSKSDRRMKSLIRRVGAFTLKPHRGSVFEGLMKSIVYQQLSTKAARTIHGRLLGKLPGRPAEHAQALLEFSDEQFRAVGVSRPKMLALRDLAEKTASGNLPTRRKLARLTDDEIADLLIAVRGVGRWTAEMILIFWLGRPDVLPVLDLGVRRGFALTYGHDELPQPDLVHEYGARWKPFRSVAAWYLWRAVDLHRTSGTVGQW